MAKAKQEPVLEEVLTEEKNGNSEESNQAADQNSEPAEEVAKTAKATAKAGKRSAKSIKEAEELEAKEERKAARASGEVEAAKSKAPVKPARSRLERAGKKLRKAAELVDKTKEYSLEEGVELVIKTSTTKFDGTVELHVNLSVDPRQADQNVRGTLVLPAGTGKTVRVAAFVEADDSDKAKKAGADIFDQGELLQQLDKGVMNFDVLIATPATMAKLGKYARVLGPKGLMPNPKSGTVTADVAKAISEAKAGRVEYRVDTTGIVHLGIGKVSFGGPKVLENLNTVVASLKAAKPASVKGTYVKSAYLTTTMGPSVRLSTSQF